MILETKQVLFRAHVHSLDRRSSNAHDHFEQTINDNTNEYLNTILKNGFIPTILLPTRVASHTCTLIDHIYHQSRNSRIPILSENFLTDMRNHFANFIILHSKTKI